MHNEKDTPDVPQTGDNTNLPLMLGLMLASLAGLVATLLFSRRERRRAK